jgi:ligand-binding sensor protein
MEVMEIYGKEKWQEMLNELSGKMAMTVALLDADAALLLSSGELNPLCSRIREKKENRTFICSQTARAMTGEIKVTKEPSVEICEAGMIRFAVPVVREDEMIGQVIGCGVITDPEEIMPDMLAQQTGENEETIKDLVKQVKEEKQEDVEAAVQELFKTLNG